MPFTLCKSDPSFINNAEKSHLIQSSYTLKYVSASKSTPFFFCFVSSDTREIFSPYKFYFLSAGKPLLCLYTQKKQKVSLPYTRLFISPAVITEGSEGTSVSLSRCSHQTSRYCVGSQQEKQRGAQIVMEMKRLPKVSTCCQLWKEKA